MERMSLEWVPRVRYSDPVRSGGIDGTGSEYRTRGTQTTSGEAHQSPRMPVGLARGSTPPDLLGIRKRYLDKSSSIRLNI